VPSFQEIKMLGYRIRKKLWIIEERVKNSDDDPYGPWETVVDWNCTYGGHCSILSFVSRQRAQDAIKSLSWDSNPGYQYRIRAFKRC